MTHTKKKTRQRESEHNVDNGNACCTSNTKDALLSALTTVPCKLYRQYNYIRLRPRLFLHDQTASFSLMRFTAMHRYDGKEKDKIAVRLYPRGR
jgi:hypothetical protein